MCAVYRKLDCVELKWYLDFTSKKVCYTFNSTTKDVTNEYDIVDSIFDFYIGDSNK